MSLICLTYCWCMPAIICVAAPNAANGSPIVLIMLPNVPGTSAADGGFEACPPVACSAVAAAASKNGFHICCPFSISDDRYCVGSAGSLVCVAIVVLLL